MKNPEYKAICVKRKTHKKFSIRALEEELTHDALVNKLLIKKVVKS